MTSGAGTGRGEFEPLTQAAAGLRSLPTRQVVTEEEPHPNTRAGSRSRQVGAAFLLTGRALYVSQAAQAHRRLPHADYFARNVRTIQVLAPRRATWRRGPFSGCAWTTSNTSNTCLPWLRLEGEGRPMGSSHACHHLSVSCREVAGAADGPLSGDGSGGRWPETGARRSPTAACWPASRRRPAPGRSPRCSRPTRGAPAARPPWAGSGSGRWRS